MFIKSKILILIILLATITLTGCFGLSKAEIEKEANNLINSFEREYSNENDYVIENLLTDDFLYYYEENNQTYEADKQEFVNMLEDYFYNYRVINFELTNRTTNVQNQTKVIITADLNETYEDLDYGDEYDYQMKTKFTIEKIGGKWLISEFIPGNN